MSDDFPSGSDPLQFLMKNMLGGQFGSAFGQGTDFRWEMVSSMASLSLAGPDGTLYEPNVDPSLRIKIDRLFELAEMRFETLDMLPDLAKANRTVQVVNHQGLIKIYLERQKETFQSLLDALTPDADPGSGPSDENDPAAQMERMMMMMQRIAAPAMVASQLGWVLGEFAKTCVGPLELTIPRAATGGVELVGSNLAAFADRHGLDFDQLALWTLIRELVHLSILSTPQVRERLETLIALHIADRGSATNSTMQALSEIDPTDPEAMKALLANPASLISIPVNDAQLRTQSEIEAILSFTEGMVQYQTRLAAAYLIGDFTAIETATSSHRFNPGNPMQSISAMLGITVTEAMLEMGAAFISGVLERDGGPALAKVWTDSQRLPTPAEIGAPGLWLARMEFL